MLVQGHVQIISQRRSHVFDGLTGVVNSLNVRRFARDQFDTPRYAREPSRNPLNPLTPSRQSKKSMTLILRSRETRYGRGSVPASPLRGVLRRGGCRRLALGARCGSWTARRFRTVALVALLAAGCGGSSTADVLEVPTTAAPARVADAPVVEVVPAQAPPPLDPSAGPRTPLGELRARYLPVWSSDFDWAFPPEVCGSEWALDAIAEPTTGADLNVLGDYVAAATLAVMRYEHLLSRALEEPNILGQLCIAVATVGSTRTDTLDLLATYPAAGIRTADPATYPDEVTIVAAIPAAALAVACVTPGYPGVVTADGEVVDDAQAPVALQAYRLDVSQGLEDAVTDISYRVADMVDRPAEACDELDSWATEWRQQAQDWAADGELWAPVERTVTADRLCDLSLSDGSGECPREW